MDVKEAVQRAKECIAEVFGGEDIGGLRLEEVVFADPSPRWKITISFMRPESLAGVAATLAAISGQQYKRSLKVVEISDDSGRVLSVTNRLWPNGGQ